jgi:hypothetical protein
MPTVELARQSQLFMCFVLDYATHAHGFLHLLHYDIPFQWDEHAQIAFEYLKEALSNSPLISPPDYDRDYILYLSAFVVFVAGVLIQLGDNGCEHVIYYISKNLSRPPLRNIPPTSPQKPRKASIW